MGNHAGLGHTLNACQDGASAVGVERHLGCFHFEHTAKVVMNVHSIESWNAKALVRENLRRQGELAKSTPLRLIPVLDGLKYINECLHILAGPVGRGLDMLMCRRGYHMKREQFVTICWEMMRDLKDYRGNRVRRKPADQQELYEIFDSMDFDRSGELSTGEWAGGCSVFFHGSMEDSVRAVFQILDQNKDGHLTQPELREYMRPFVKAMIPERAAALQPMLLKRATEVIFREMDKEIKGDGVITAEEMIKWTAEGKNIIDSLATVIDREVYTLWQKNNQERLRRNFNAWDQPSPQTPSLMGQIGQSRSPDKVPVKQGGGFFEIFGLKQEAFAAWGQQPANEQPGPGSSPHTGSCAGSPEGNGGWGGSPFSQQDRNSGFGAGHGDRGAALQSQTSHMSMQSYGGAPSTNHFESTASHWENVPPPPPAPRRGDRGSALQSQTSHMSSAYGGRGAALQSQTSHMSSAYGGGGYH